jgi:signal transduction histidine kinase
VSTAAIPNERSASRSPAESPVTRILVWSFLLGVLSLAFLDRAQVRESLTDHWPHLLFWMGLLVVVNLLPVQAHHLTLTLDVPLTLAVAFLYEPAVAALLAGMAALDRRELRGEISLSRATFNRAQIAASVYFASAIFHWMVPGVQAWYTVLVGTVSAVLVDYGTNTLLVMVFERINSGNGFRATFDRLRVGRASEFLLTYLGYGLLALAVATLYRHEGAWAVAVFLIPIGVARQLLIRNQELHSAARKLRAREILLERLFRGVVEERRDERARVAADLHDDVLQAITRISQIATTLQGRTTAKARRQDIEDLTYAAEYSLTSIREVMHNLKNSPLGAGGLVQTARALAREVQLQSGVRVQTTMPARVDGSPEEQLVAYQVIREAVRNAATHAAPGIIRISINQTNSAVMLAIEDDGCGFDPDAVDHAAHFGLQLMHERLEMIGGSMTLKSVPGSGTLVSAMVPLSGPETATPFVVP